MEDEKRLSVVVLHDLLEGDFESRLKRPENKTPRKLFLVFQGGAELVLLGLKENYSCTRRSGTDPDRRESGCARQDTA